MENYNPDYTVETVIHFAKAFKNSFGEYGSDLSESDLKLIKLWETKGKYAETEFWSNNEVYIIYSDQHECLGHLYCKWTGPYKQANLYS